MYAAIYPEPKGLESNVAYLRLWCDRLNHDELPALKLQVVHGDGGMYNEKASGKRHLEVLDATMGILATVTEDTIREWP